MRTNAALLPLVFAALLASAAPGSAQLPAPEYPPIHGVFVRDTALGDALDEVVERGVRLVKSPLKRLFARGRIRALNTPHAWVLIEARGDSVRIATDLWDVTLPPAGTVLTRKPDGEVFEVSGHWDGFAFRQVWVAPDGRRENVFALSPDGAVLTMDVEIGSPQLRAPLRYRHVYLRR